MLPWLEPGGGGAAAEADLPEPPCSEKLDLGSGMGDVLTSPRLTKGVKSLLLRDQSRVALDSFFLRRSA